MESNKESESWRTLYWILEKKFLWIVMQNLINLTNLAQNVIKSYTESYKNLTNLKQNRVKSYLRIL